MALDAFDGSRHENRNILKREDWQTEEVKEKIRKIMRDKQDLNLVHLLESA